MNKGLGQQKMSDYITQSSNTCIPDGIEEAQLGEITKV